MQRPAESSGNTWHIGQSVPAGTPSVGSPSPDIWRPMFHASRAGEGRVASSVTGGCHALEGGGQSRCLCCLLAFMWFLCSWTAPSLLAVFRQQGFAEVEVVSPSWWEHSPGLCCQRSNGERSWLDAAPLADACARLSAPRSSWCLPPTQAVLLALVKWKYGGRVVLPQLGRSSQPVREVFFLVLAVTGFQTSRQRSFPRKCD